MLLTCSMIFLAELLFVFDIVLTYKKHKASGMLLVVGNAAYVVNSIGHILRCIAYYTRVLGWPNRYAVWPYILGGIIPRDMPFFPNITSFFGDICLFLMTFFPLLAVIAIMLKNKGKHRLLIIIITSITMIFVLTLNYFILVILYEACLRPTGFWKAMKMNGF